MSNKDFYLSREWRALRFKVLLQYGRRCMCCNATNKVLHVDHIKPISKYPELRLTQSNLQVLCEDCNLGKSNIYETDFRPKQKPPRIHKKEGPRVEAKRVESFDKTTIFNKVGYFTKGRGACWHLWDGQKTLCGSHKYNTLIGKPSQKFNQAGVPNICKACFGVMVADFAISNWMDFKGYCVEEVGVVGLFNGVPVKFKTRKKVAKIKEATSLGVAGLVEKQGLASNQLN